MKQIHFLILLLLTVILTSCSNDDDQIVFEQNDYLNTNNIGDVAKIYGSDIVINDSSLYIIYGNRNQHDWFGLFDIDSKLLQKEWIGQIRPCEYFKQPTVGFWASQLFKKTESNNFACIISNDSTYKQSVSLYINGAIKYGKVLGTNPFIINEELYLKHHDLSDEVIFDVYNSDGEIYAKDCSINFLTQKNGVGLSVFVAFKDEHLWIATDCNNHISEAISSKEYKRNRKIDLGYGESVDAKVESVYLSNSFYQASDNSLFLVFPHMYFKELLILKDGKIDCIQFSAETKESFRDWFNKSILFSTYVLNTKGEILEEIKTDGKPFDETAAAVSYTDIIEFMSPNMKRRNLKSDEIIWSTKIEKLENIGDARINYSVIEQTDSYIISKCDITHRDGKKESISFKTMIDSGEIIML